MAEDVKLDRNLALEVVRVTEAAALAASKLMGRGEYVVERPGGLDGGAHFGRHPRRAGIQELPLRAVLRRPGLGRGRCPDAVRPDSCPAGEGRRRVGSKQR